MKKNEGDTVPASYEVQGEKISLYTSCVSWEDRKMRFNEQRNNTYLIVVIGFPLSQRG